MWLPLSLGSEAIRHLESGADWRVTPFPLIIQSFDCSVHIMAIQQVPARHLA